MNRTVLAVVAIAIGVTAVAAQSDPIAARKELMKGIGAQTKTGGDTAALPAIWDNKADFDAKFTKFGADAKAAQGAVKDLDTFKAAFGGLTKNCGGCHETYRAKKS